jgi:hypothetical protein
MKSESGFEIDGHEETSVFTSVVYDLLCMTVTSLKIRAVSLPSFTFLLACAAMTRAKQPFRYLAFLDFEATCDEPNPPVQVRERQLEELHSCSSELLFPFLSQR